MKKAFSTLAVLLFAAFFFIPQAAASETGLMTPAATGGEVDAVTPAITVVAEADTDAAASTGGGADAPTTDADLLGDGKEVVSLFRSQEWALGISALIMLGLALLRRFRVLDRIPSKYVPWVSACLGLLLALGDALSTGGALTANRILMGLASGLAASGLWGLVGKHIPLLAQVPADD